MTLSRLTGVAAIILALAGCSSNPRPSEATLNARLSASLEAGTILVGGGRFVPEGDRFLARTFCAAAAAAAVHNVQAVAFQGGVDRKSVAKGGVFHKPDFRFRPMSAPGGRGLDGADLGLSDRKLDSYRDGVFHVTDAYGADPRIYSVAMLNADCSAVGY